MSKPIFCNVCNKAPCQCMKTDIPVTARGWDLVETSVGPEVEKPKMTVIDYETLPQTTLNIGRKMCKLGECPAGSLVRWDERWPGCVWLVTDDENGKNLVHLPSFSDADDKSTYNDNTRVEIFGFLNVTVQ